MSAVHRLPPGDELQQEDAEREHVRLLVHDAVREVLRRQAPVITYVQYRGGTPVSASSILRRPAVRIRMALHCIALLSHE